MKKRVLFIGIIFGVFVILATLAGCSQNNQSASNKKVALSKEQFKTIAKDNGFTVFEEKDNYIQATPSTEGSKNVLLFWDCADEKEAADVYKEQESTVVLSNKKTDSGDNYQSVITTEEDGQLYWTSYLCRVDNTVLQLFVGDETKEGGQKLIAAFGY